MPRSINLDTDDFDQVSAILARVADLYRDKADGEGDRGGLWIDLAELLDAASDKADRIVGQYL